MRQALPRARAWRVSVALLVSAATAGRSVAALAGGQAGTPDAPAYRLTAEDEAFLEDLSSRSFRYFDEQADPVTGQVRDRARTDGSPHEERSRHVASIAATGFGLTGLCIAAERGWLPREEARRRAHTTVRHLAVQMPHERGWFYHFVDARTGARVWRSELSSIDTALLLAGVLSVRQCFSDHPEIVRNADAVYRRVDFPWMLNGDPHRLSMGWRPESGFIASRWDHYSELMILYLLGIASPAHPLPPESWGSWTRPWMVYRGYRYVSGTPPLFVHQYSHAWVDFRGRRERDAPFIDWWENSVVATRAHKEFCASLAREFPSYRDGLWGITSSDSRRGYVAWGGPPRTNDIDGSVVPCAAAGSLMLAPDIALPVLRAMRERFGDRIYGRYGFADAFHPVDGWVNPDVIGIDVGISLLSAENLRTGAVWRWFMANPAVKQALEVVGLAPVPSPDLEYRVIPPFGAAEQAAAAVVANAAEEIPAAAFEGAEFTAGNGVRLPFRLLRPLESVSAPAGRGKAESPASRWPLVVVFHGAGEIGTDNVKQLTALAKVWALSENRRLFPAFVLVPQFPGRASEYSGPVGQAGRTSAPAPPLHAALELVDSLRTTLPVDRSRVYLVGFSMGASAAWNALELRPDLFAAAIPIAGVPGQADPVPATPVWALHGDRDETNAIQHDRVAYDSYRRRLGVEMRFWELEDLGHALPLPLLTGGDLARWLFAHVKDRMRERSGRP